MPSQGAWRAKVRIFTRSFLGGGGSGGYGGPQVSRQKFHVEFKWEEMDRENSFLFFSLA